MPDYKRKQIKHYIDNICLPNRHEEPLDKFIVMFYEWKKKYELEYSNLTVVFERGGDIELYGVGDEKDYEYNSRIEKEQEAEEELILFSEEMKQQQRYKQYLELKKEFEDKE